MLAIIWSMGLSKLTHQLLPSPHMCLFQTAANRRSECRQWPSKGSTHIWQGSHARISTCCLWNKYPSMTQVAGSNDLGFNETALCHYFTTFLEKEMATHSSILAWRIPWAEEPGRLQSTGSQSQTRLSDWACMHAPPFKKFFLFLYNF